MAFEVPMIDRGGDLKRLIECRDLIRRIVRATVRHDDCTPSGSYRAADAYNCQVLLDTLELIDVICVELGGPQTVHYVDCIRRRRGSGLN